MPWLALALLSAFLIVVFPLREIRRRSQFGDIGRVDWRRPRPRAWKVADALFLVGFTFSLAGLALQGAGVLAAVFVPSSMLQVFAVALTVAATALAIWAQGTMGLAWRADIAPAERCEVVTSGPFALVRNPTYVAMATAIAGTLLLAPNVCNVGGWLLVLADAVVALRVLETLADPLAALRECLRVLRPDGRVIAAFSSRPERTTAALLARPAGTVMQHLFAGRFLTEQERPLHTCSMDCIHRHTFGYVTVTTCGKRCQLSTVPARRQRSDLAWP